VSPKPQLDPIISHRYQEMHDSCDFIIHHEHETLTYAKDVSKRLEVTKGSYKTSGDDVAE
jgi:hypothetical protein